jgi:hypothetical protein
MTLILCYFIFRYFYNDHPREKELFSAVKNNDYYKTKMLLEDKVNPNIYDYGDLNPYVLPFYLNPLSLPFWAFLFQGPDKENITKDTPIIIAVKNNNKELAQLLLEFGADPTLQNKSGQNAFSFYIPTSL